MTRERLNKVDEQDFLYPVNLPTTEEFGESYHTYKNVAVDEFRFLFDAIVTPESFITCMVVTDILKLPALTGIAQHCRELVEASGNLERWSFQKQFIGAVVCNLMEANGYEKKGQKKAVPINYYTKGEVYRRKP